MSTELDARKALKTLSAELDARRPQITKWEAYYAGEHDLLFATTKFREVFGSMFEAFSSNWCALVVDSVVERMTVEGFRFGATRGGDDLASALWQANRMDRESVLATRLANICGVAYGMVEPPPVGGGMPSITIEHPLEVIVATASGGHRRTSALKKWIGPDGQEWANVYFDDLVWKFTRSRQTVGAVAGDQSSTDRYLLIPPGTRSVSSDRTGWQLRELEPTPNPLGVVPIVPIVPTVSLRGGRRTGVSRIAGVVPLQNLVNKIFADAVVASEFAAFPQRWATGIELVDPEQDAAGSVEEKAHLQRFVSGLERIWLEGDPNAKFGTLEPASLTPYVELIETAVQHIAAQTKTPAHYLLAKMVNISGDALKAAETGLVHVCQAQTISVGEGWEDIMRLGFLAQGNFERGRELRVETIWGDVESRTEGERADAAVKVAPFVSQRAVLRRLGYSEQEQTRIIAEKREEDELALTAGVDLGGGNRAPAAA